MATITELKAELEKLQSDIREVNMEMEFKKRFLETKRIRVTEKMEIKGTGANAVLQVGGNAHIKKISKTGETGQLVNEIGKRVSDNLAADSEFRAAAKGDKGDRGPHGDQGTQGARGDRGSAGSQGDKGPSGPQGMDGICLDHI